MAEPWLEKNMHPRTIITAFTRALDDALAYLKTIATPIDLNNRAEVLNVVKCCLGTKFSSQFYPPFLSDMALDAVAMVATTTEGRRDIDIKRFVRIEKVWLHSPAPPSHLCGNDGRTKYFRSTDKLCGNNFKLTTH